MKSPVKHIVFKDMRRFWPLLTLWCAALGVQVAFPGWLEETASGSMQEESLFAFVLVLLVNVQLVTKVLAEDSPLKEGAFWRTRPVAGAQMLAAKLLFLGGWTLLLPALVTASGAVAYGFDAGETVQAVLGRLVLHGLLGGGLFVLAIFTQRIWATLLTGWLVLTVFGTWLSVSRSSGGTRSSNEVEWGEVAVSLAATRWLLAACVLLVGVGVAAWLIYRDRRRGVAAVAAGIGLAAAFGVIRSWPLDWLGWSPAFRTSKTEEQGRLRAEVERMEVGDAGLTVNGQRFDRVGATLRWTGLAEGEACVVHKVEGRLSGANGVERAQALRFPGGGGRAGLPEALGALGTDKFVGGGRVGGATEWVTLAEAPEAELDAFRVAGAQWRGRVYVRVGKLTPVWRMPLRRGEKWAEGAARARIVEAPRAGNGVRVVVWEREPDRPRWAWDANASEADAGRPMQSYVLINAGLGAFVLPVGSGGRRSSRDGLFNTSQHEGTFDVPGSPPGPDWREGAELVKLRFVETRRVEVDVSATVDFAAAR